MHKKRWSEQEKSLAKKLRSDGATYSEISKKMGVAKSTLNIWLKDLPLKDHLYFANRQEWLKSIRKLSAESIKRKRNLEIETIANRVKADVEKWEIFTSIQVQKAILSVLYWAEGTKLPIRGASVKFANTDPRLALLFLTLLRNCFQLDEKKLRVRLYLHWYHDVQATKKFWSNILDIDEGRFTKTFIKKRSPTKRFRRNFAGICFITYYSVDLRWEIMHTAYNVQENLTGKINIPVFIG